jgi:hypothetical protein
MPELRGQAALIYAALPLGEWRTATQVAARAGIQRNGADTPLWNLHGLGLVERRYATDAEWHARAGRGIRPAVWRRKESA